MVKTTIVGAGSVIFSQKIIMDVLGFEELKNCKFTLMDINLKKLENSFSLTKRAIEDNNLSAKLEKTNNLDNALDGADFVVLMIDTPAVEAIKYDNLIPYKYGVNQVIGDTLGPGGVFKALRLIPQVVDICKRAEKLCPNALIINYVNPMAMVTWAIGEATKMKYVGICHGVKGTVRRLATFLEIPEEEIDYWIAGINHMAWVLKFEHQGKDLYPLIWKKLKETKIEDIRKAKKEFKGGFSPWYEMFDEKYRIEMMKVTGYFMTETSGHLSEYLPYFRKRKDIIKKFDGDEDWKGSSMYYYRTIAGIRKKYDKDVERMVRSKHPIKIAEKSIEYAPDIIYASVTNKYFRFNGNVRNTGLITNVQQNACVEVPCFVDRLGVHPCYVGDLPEICAALNRTNINVQELGVKAALNKDMKFAYHAILMDPLTSAVLSPDEIKKMVNEMFKAEKKWLKGYKSKM
ncbi:MAG: alpha-galactosidase [Candidatus Firestonebacteria bacterium]